MTTPATTTIRLVDLWQQARSLFEGTTDEHPEVDIVNLNPREMQRSLLYLLEHSRECTANFVDTATQAPLDMPSPQAAVHGILTGQIKAGFWLDIPLLPPMGVFVDHPRILSVSYARQGWSALSVLVFFDLLHRIITMAPAAEIVPDAYCYTLDEQERFTNAWQRYARPSLVV